MKKLLITGDSLSYNRYDYDETPRTNGWDCFIGMQSWSFKLRNSFITSAVGFKYGNDLEISGKAIETANENNLIFGKKVSVCEPIDGKIEFKANSDTGSVVLYLQKSPSNYCRFDISVDGKTVKTGVDTYGGDYIHQGYDLIVIELPCDKREEHIIVFENFEHIEENTPYVIIAGVSAEARFANITGQGSRTSKFLLYHFENRIATYKPDIMVLICGANDVLYFSPEKYGENLDRLISKTKQVSPGCKFVTVTIPPSKWISEIIQGEKYTSQEQFDALLAKYTAAMGEISEKHGAICVKTEEVFDGISSDIWRFDNIHMSKKGNDMLFEKLVSLNIF